MEHLTKHAAAFTEHDRGNNHPNEYSHVQHFLQLFYPVIASDHIPSLPSNIISDDERMNFILTHFPGDWLQYQHLISKQWTHIGALHLHSYGLPFTVWFGNNNVRYTHTSQQLALASFGFTTDFSKTFAPLLTKTLSGTSGDGIISRHISQSSLNRALSEMSGQQLLFSLCSPRHDMILPLLGDIELSPAFLHCIFSLLHVMHLDIGLLSRSVVVDLCSSVHPSEHHAVQQCQYSNDTTSSMTITSNHNHIAHPSVANGPIFWLEMQEYTFAQPSIVIHKQLEQLENVASSQQLSSPSNSQQQEQQQQLKPTTIPDKPPQFSHPLNILINVWAPDGTTNVMRVHNGLA